MLYWYKSTSIDAGGGAQRHVKSCAKKHGKEPLSPGGKVRFTGTKVLVYLLDWYKKYKKPLSPGGKVRFTGTKVLVYLRYWWQKYLRTCLLAVTGTKARKACGGAEYGGAGGGGSRSGGGGGLGSSNGATTYAAADTYDNAGVPHLYEAHFGSGT